MRLLKLIPDHTEINFVGVRYYAFAIDGLLLLASLVSIWTYGFNLGIDFTGGVLIEAQQCVAAVDVKNPVCKGKVIDIAALRAKVDTLGFKQTELQYFGGGECEIPANSCVLIRVQPQAGAAEQAIANTAHDALGQDFVFRRVEVVGPKVSGELFRDGVIATLLAVMMITIYVTVRFEWQFGVGALIATGHDVFVTAGMFSLLHMNFDLTSVAALLTLAGYSVNDTVVVFDRIRENRRRYKRLPLPELINLSTNQTLSRTVLTSGATAISIIPLLIWGGPTLFEFTAAILFGIVVGTFSSIYVASALLLYLPSIVRGEEAATATR